jgi:hypothetical protein
MKNILTKKILLTIAAATFLLIPGASAALDEPQSGDGDGLPPVCYDNGRVAVAVDVFDDPCTQTCVGPGNVNVAVTLTGDVSQCSKEGGDKVICIANVNIAVSMYGEVQQCTSNGPGAQTTCIATINVAVQFVVTSLDQCSAIVEENQLV